MICDYEKQRQLNIQSNTALLKELGLDRPVFEPKKKRTRKQAKPKSVPKKWESEDEEDDDSQPARKTQRTSVELDVAATGVRRSARNTGKQVDYNSEPHKGIPEPVVKTLQNERPSGSAGGKRTHNPKTFGHIPGIEVSMRWGTRQGCSEDAIHAPWVAGISGGSEGAYSVALSGGYEDDVDLGYAFTYTGSGGRDLRGTKKAPKNLRTAPQSSDQSFEHPYNSTLLKSVKTKNPVRVIRGFKLKSKYAPSEGYRYDGLYTIEKAWMEKGLNPKGYLVCKFAFKRLPGQPPIPEDGDDGEDSQGEDEDEDEC